jgi:hypothetical protein
LPGLHFGGLTRMRAKHRGNIGHGGGSFAKAVP